MQQTYGTRKKRAHDYVGLMPIRFTVDGEMYVER
jgi:hypothetical protein